ncbi:MAG: hypothetical protein GY714_14110 [Desulfobacterales bacterium]|nr:hypothetical protein [Desulfobacterales bacterium]
MKSDPKKQKSVEMELFTLTSYYVYLFKIILGEDSEMNFCFGEMKTISEGHIQYRIKYKAANFSLIDECLKTWKIPFKTNRNGIMTHSKDGKKKVSKQGLVHQVGSPIMLI